MRITAIIAAAGKSQRFAPGTAKNKLEQDMGGRTVLLRSIEALANRSEVTAILVAVNPDSIDEFRERYGDSLAVRGAKIVAGGRAERWETVKNALAHVPALPASTASGDEHAATHIAVHDAARPCVSAELLDRLFEAAALFDAVIPAVPVSETLKRVSDEIEAAAHDDVIASAILGDAGRESAVARRVVGTIDRTNLWAVQTPQVFAADLLRRAYENNGTRGTGVPPVSSSGGTGFQPVSPTDDAMLVERLGEPVRVVPGDPLNIKITTEADLRLARLILNVKPPADRPVHMRF